MGPKRPLRSLAANVELELREKRAVIDGEKRNVVDFLEPVSKVERCNSQDFF